MTGGRAFAVLAVAAIVTLPAVTTRIYASDEIQFFAWLRSVAFDRDVSFENEYRHFYDTGATRDPGFRETFLERTNEAGRRINNAPIGSAILWAPFYAAGHAAALATGAPADGYSRPYVTAVAWGSAVYGWLAVLLSAAIARRITGRGLAAALVVLAGTPLLFYLYVAPVFSHANSAFAVALFLWVWLRVRDAWRPGGVALLAASGALMAMVREQDAFFLAGPALDAIRALVRTPGPARPRRLAALAIAAPVLFLAYAPQLAAYTALNGHPGPSVITARKMTWTSPHAAGVFASPEHGLLAWTPLAALALAGLVWLAAGRARGAGTDARWIAGLALAMAALQVYVSGSVESWTVAGSFGQRRFVALTPLFAAGLAALPFWRPASGWARRAGMAALAVAIWWNLGLMIQFGTHRMDRQRLVLRDNARRTFLELPREAPAIAWRYLTDRGSFYGQPRQ